MKSFLFFAIGLLLSLNAFATRITPEQARSKSQLHLGLDYRFIEQVDQSRAFQQFWTVQGAIPIHPRWKFQPEFAYARDHSSNGNFKIQDFEYNLIGWFMYQTRTWKVFHPSIGMGGGSYLRQTTSELGKSTRIRSSDPLLMTGFQASVRVYVEDKIFLDARTRTLFGEDFLDVPTMSFQILVGVEPWR